MNNFDISYQNLLKEIIDRGVLTIKKKEEIKFLCAKSLSHKLVDGFPISSIQNIKWDKIFYELMWHLNGDLNIKFLLDHNIDKYNQTAYKKYLFESKNDYLLKEKEFIEQIKYNDKTSPWVIKYGKLDTTTGYQWINKETNNGCVNQLENIINKLLVSLDESNIILESSHESIFSDDSDWPCTYIQIITNRLNQKERVELYKNNKKEIDKDKIYSSIIDDIQYYQDDLFLFNEELDNSKIPKFKISMVWNQPQIDCHNDLLKNFIFFGFLLKIISEKVNMVPNEIHGNFGIVYFKNSDLNIIEEQINRKPINLPSLILKNREKFNYKLDDFQFINHNVHPDFSKKRK